MVLAVALVFGSVPRFVLRRRAHLDLTTSIVLSMLGTAIGLLIAGAVLPHLRLWSPITILLGLACSIVAVALYGAVATHFQRQHHIPITELIAGGESDHVEFKSTARINLRTEQKDPRMEHVIVKTVSAFVNADGGTLLIGVDDDGTPLGLDADYATLKVPDADRFELWLRDLFTTALGQNSAVAVGVSIEDVPPTTVRSRCAASGASPHPSPCTCGPARTARPSSGCAPAIPAANSPSTRPPTTSCIAGRSAPVPRSPPRHERRCGSPLNDSHVVML
ncbi:hypothetical protein Gbro_1143 [Gordonia bronchialis DSM 43247]|uniref:Schlafen AlbA-2 domain-containing protein n=1 Tax=Gordonia bronchialis (strain ATCC 25592 / DSM 43247 / BCRC 13721 / JCM 3198 / KCTC 3076 / NBRC 16047 / NCTC 10667) TaxID=526226 RepID=D0L4Z9_GORB4|nr:hypothetical protein Gbro_1143 [Gordonia bronchialis DSM 43247]STQ63256.1 Divergent AAA domain [Gordonia bronchialis]